MKHIFAYSRKEINMSKEIRNYVEEARGMSLDDYLNLRKKLFKGDEDVPKNLILSLFP